MVEGARRIGRQGPGGARAGPAAQPAPRPTAHGPRSHEADHWLLVTVVALAGALALLVGVIALPGAGVEAGGARRWLDLGPLPQFQPSELAKMALVLYMADWLARKGPRLRSWV